jgi:hypothetical protein
MGCTGRPVAVPTSCAIECGSPVKGLADSYLQLDMGVMSICRGVHCSHFQANLRLRGAHGGQRLSFLVVAPRATAAVQSARPTSLWRCVRKHQAVRCRVSSRLAVMASLSRRERWTGGAYRVRCLGLHAPWFLQILVESWLFPSSSHDV